MKNILIVAYHFPPRGGIAVKRTLKFAKTFPLFNWNPVIITVKLNLHEYKILDTSLLDELPKGLRIYRTEHLKKRLFQVVKLPKSKPDMSKEQILEKLFIDPKEDLLKRLINFIFSHLWLYIPDIESGWIPYAVMNGKYILNEEKIDAIYTTSPPHSTHLIGYYLSKYSGKPWIADFRDDWVSNPLFRPSNIILAKIHKVIESAVVKNANKIIVTNNHTKGSFLRKHPSCHKDNILVIPNGYDPADFEDLDKKPFPKFTMIHTGNLGNGLYAKYFLLALKSLIDERPELKEDIRSLFIGAVPAEDKKIINELKLNDIIRIQEYLPYKECLQQLVRSHLFLLFLTAEAGGAARTPAKIYEYLAAGRPILGMIIEGDAADKIRGMRAGSIIDPTDVDGIKKEIYMYYQKYLSNKEEYLRPATSHEYLDRYNQNSLTKKLVEALLEPCRKVK